MNRHLIQLLWPCVAASLVVGACNKVTPTPQKVTPTPQKVIALFVLKVVMVGEEECWVHTGSTLELVRVEGKYALLRYATPQIKVEDCSAFPECSNGASIVMTEAEYRILGRIYADTVENQRKHELRDTARRFTDDPTSED